MSNQNPYPKTITMGVTGGSGIPYMLRLLEYILKAGNNVYLTFSQAAQMVAALETDLKLPSQPAKLHEYFVERFAINANQLKVYAANDWTAPIASGSAKVDAMVIIPCSSGCVAAVANGSSDNLIERAADVMIKENRKLILVHRETPLSALHLENLLKLARIGVTILPANPGFYYKPQSVNDLVDFVVARVLDHLNIEHSLLPEWGVEQSEVNHG